MALIKCNECGKMVSDTTDKCIHCGAPVNKGEEKVEKVEKKETSNKQNNNIVGFVLALVAAICGFIFLVKMSLRSFALIYTLFLLASSIVLTIYNYPSKKQNSTLLYIALATLFLGSLARIVQEGIGWEYLARYTLLALSAIVLIYHTYKGNKPDKMIAFIMLAIVAVDAIYNFFALNNSIISGYYWRLYLIAEPFMAVALMFTNYTKANLNDGIKKIVDKLPNIIIPVIIVLVLAAVFFLLSMEDKGKVPSNLDKNDIDKSGFNVDEFNDDDDDDDKNTPAEKVVINKSTKTVTTTYSDEEQKAEISLEKIYVTKKVLPPKPRQSYYHYYEAKEGKRYLVAILNVKNIGSKTINTDYVFTNFLGDNCSLKAIVDGQYEYSGFVVGLDKDSKKYDLDSYYYLDALEKTQMYLIFDISSEVADKPVKITGCFGDLNLELDNSEN